MITVSDDHLDRIIDDGTYNNLILFAMAVELKESRTKLAACETRSVPDETAPTAEVIQALGMALSALISHGRDVPEVTKQYIRDVLNRHRAALLAGKGEQ